MASVGSGTFHAPSSSSQSPEFFGPIFPRSSVIYCEVFIYIVRHISGELPGPIIFDCNKHQKSQPPLTKSIHFPTVVPDGEEAFIWKGQFQSISAPTESAMLAL